MEPSDDKMNRVEMASAHRRVKMVDEEETYVEHAWMMTPQDRRFRPSVYGSRGRVSTFLRRREQPRGSLGTRACASR